MGKYLIEIFGVYGKGDADKEVESFVINSIDELEEAMEGYEWLCSDGGKSDYQRFVKGEVTSATFPHYGDWDEPDEYEIVRTSYKEKLEQIEKEYKYKKEELNKRFGN
jgi:hypothetical protein